MTASARVPTVAARPRKDTATASIGSRLSRRVSVNALISELPPRW
ncbi:hypothetical protein [Nonomuraea dietziae]